MHSLVTAYKRKNYAVFRSIGRKNYTISGSIGISTPSISVSKSAWRTSPRLCYNFLVVLSEFIDGALTRQFLAPTGAARRESRG